jgi:ADP-heptose:LPS heptosyltransferase
MNQAWANARNILIMRPDNIGDVVMTSPALRAIKANLPQARLTLMASPGGAQAAPLLPWLDDVLTWRVVWQDLGRLAFDPGREWELITTLRQRRFDAAIIFTSFKQTPHPAGYACYLAGIPLRLGESKEWGGGVLTDELLSAPDELHQAERNLRLIESVGFQVADRRLAIQLQEDACQGAAAWLAKYGLATTDPYLLLSPWASCQARMYFPDRFAAAARGLAQATGWPVLVTGAARDRERSEVILNGLSSCGLDLVGATSVPELAALIAGAKLVLANDSLAMHLADATGTPSVILYSGTEYESQWQPRHSPFRLLRRPTPCSPCYAFTCPYSMECLDIPPEEVITAGLELLRTSQQN